MSSSLVLNLAKVIVLCSSLTVCSEKHTVTKTGDSPFCFSENQLGRVNDFDEF